MPWGLTQSSPYSFDCTFRRRRKRRLQPRRLVRGHFAGLQPQAVLYDQRVVLGDVTLKIAAKTPVIPFTEASFLWIGRMVEVAGREALLVQDEAHRIPRKIDHPLVARPVAFLAHLALGAVGMQVVRFFLGVDGNIVMRAELEACVLRIAVDADIAAGCLEA